MATNPADIDPRTAADPVLRVEGLTTEFRTSAGQALAVDGLSYEVHAGETLALVGESGSGKSVSALSVMGLVPDPPGRVVGGHAWLEGTDLISLDRESRRRLRGRRIAMIFQEPMSALNPVLSIRRQMLEGIREHLGLDERAAEAHAIEMLRKVHIPAPERRLKEYPHQLSGGMLQRVMIAMAIACRPRVLIADEPTTALDVTVQAQVLAIMQELQRELGTAILLITHDMGVVAEMADRVVILYAGRKVEEGPVEAVFRRPLHPYTLGLLGALPKLGRAGPVGSRQLAEIPGIVPALTDLPAGCHFAPRCRFATERCHAAYPPLEEKARGRLAACWESERLPGEMPT
ncbi:ABC transporter ATP-binding protein [Spiribacter halobius]|uniref:ABC-type dipeptide transporter n=1 Tax=Sediminicurvatus halobius TaxID=2182432 RepID=A0A2U2N1M2_9GAMM|nr:ABC transporter ATP-binding protein [Spiribacter halobius]PWG63010.1 peptide ABC transporter ATP-binding protein [Spiribacter halobius]UEX77508.1 ABC transporter ATP-binding protein [Spiribacter halobius]